jgi:hypothetical protein
MIPSDPGTFVMSFIANRLPSFLGKLLLAIWGVALLSALICWGAWHYAVLPGPVVGEQAHLATTPESNRWHMVHILAAECGCSSAVGEQLIKRRALAGVSEEVWLVGDAPELTEKLQQAGFNVVNKSPEALAQDRQIEGAPWLLIARASGAVAYSGGYAAQNPATVAQLEDVALLQRAQQGETLAAYPAFGCAMSRRAKQSFDPLGLKYSLR